MRVKICGITNSDDAQAAVEAGADALGFMLYEKSPRRVNLDQARAIIRRLPPFVARVGVFVDPAPDDVIRAIEESGIDTVQFHGAESVEFCRRFLVATIKAFRVQGEETLRQVGEYDAMAWLLDSYVPGQPGGTGATFNWELARAAVRLNPHVILAGGLTPANIQEAIQVVRPYGVDVSSGVESAPGKKDHALIRRFIEAVRISSD